MKVYDVTAYAVQEEGIILLFKAKFFVVGRLMSRGLNHESVLHERQDLEYDLHDLSAKHLSRTVDWAIQESFLNSMSTSSHWAWVAAAVERRALPPSSHRHRIHPLRTLLFVRVTTPYPSCDPFRASPVLIQSRGSST